MADIFLSYASGDRDSVRSVAAAIERQGWSVWWDRRILPGQNWDDLIATELEGARCVVVLWTRTSVVSEWVRIEANIGRERGILAPVLLDDVNIPLTFRQIQTACLSRWDGDERFPEIIALFAGIRAILDKRTTPAGPPPPLTEDRALDAALAREIPVQKPANLIAMIRCSHSTGLKAILDTDDEYGLSSEDVVSKPFELTFATDAAGRPLPAEVLLRIVSPEFNPAMQEKKILVRAERDSTVCSFLMTPREAGQLTVQLELYIREACVASRILRANGVPSGRPVTVFGHQIVTMPLYVSASTAEIGRAFRAAAPAPAPPPAPPTAAERPQSLLGSAPARSGALPPKRSSASWWKAGVAAAVVLLAVPIIRYQILLEKSPPMSIELPSADPPVAAIPPPETPAGAPKPPTPTSPKGGTPSSVDPPKRPQQEQTRPPATRVETRDLLLRSSRERLVEVRAAADRAKAALLRVRKLDAKRVELRPDVLVAERRMEAYLDSASEASKAEDAEGVERSLDLAEDALEILEEFLDL
jgi:hypothetical protein